MTEKLKPCPFCGNKARLFQNMDSTFTVQCTHCAINTADYKDPDDAKQAWNNRVY